MPFKLDIRLFASGVIALLIVGGIIAAVGYYLHINEIGTVGYTLIGIGVVIVIMYFILSFTGKKLF